MIDMGGLVIEMRKTFPSSCENLFSHRFSGKCGKGLFITQNQRLAKKISDGTTLALLRGVAFRVEQNLSPQDNEVPRDRAC
ncbi:MAG: hypothetical protein OEY97_09755 [Nitrospirota bacterium]|nr:hypothetical protein [Nitrospirota bacterium]